MASGKEIIWSRQACKERQKIPEKAQKWAQFLPSLLHSILHIKCKMYVSCKGCSLSYSSVLQNKDTQLEACTSPSHIWLMSKQSSLVIPVSLHLHFPCQVLEIHFFSHQLLGWGASTQPPLVTKDAKLIALTLDFFFMLCKIYLYVYLEFKGSLDRPVLGHRHHVLLFENNLICPTQTSSPELKADENTALQTCSYLRKTNWNYFLLNVYFVRK